MPTIAAFVTESAPVATTAAADESRLLAAARAGDDAAFLALVNRHHPALVRLATLFVPDHSAAEEMARETWRALLRETAAPHTHAGLKARLLGLLVDRACRHGDARGQTGPFARLARHALKEDEPDIAPERFNPAGGESGLHWASPPAEWGTMLDARLATPETRSRIEAAIGALPLGQRAVIALRDVECCTAEEVGAILGLPAAEQRALLHRARSRVWNALERHLAAA